MSFGENCLLEKESYPLYSPFILTGRAKRRNRAINLHLYHYAGNNPVKYNDPDGAFDWDEGKTSGSVQRNDTLSEATKEFNDKNGTNVDYHDVAAANGIKDPDKIKPGQKIDFSSFVSDKTNKETYVYNSHEDIKSTDNSDNNSNISDKGYYSNSTNIKIGAGEVLSGIGIIVGGGIAAAALAPETAGTSAMVGYDSIITGSTIFAYGLTRMVGLNNRSFGEDIKDILIPPMAAFADIKKESLK